MRAHGTHSTRHAPRARPRKASALKPDVDAPAVDFRDPLGDADLMEDYDYSLDEHAAVDEVRSHYDPEDFAPD